MARGTAMVPISGEALWYKDAVVYQLHVRSFYDSSGDGIGDIQGLIQKLDYLQDLGVTAIWLLPFYPSPLKDDGYDIANYETVNPTYGSLRDFRAFLREAHSRGLRVITELVINHTSDQHPWFQRARRAKPGTTWRDFYVWSDTPERYREARIIFKDFEHSNWAWDPVANAYYWHRFYSHQPDLNFDNPDLRREIIRVLDFWLEMGVDGLRLDAVPYLYERDGTTCENLPETHAYLRELRRHVDERFEGRMLLAEANQWPEDAVAYFGSGDECHMAFHFPLMPRMFMATRMEDRFPIIDILDQTPAIPSNCQWALFLRNHDELTLEMVTDEERDYMYRVYAEDRQARINLGIRRRLAPLLGNDRRMTELMNGLLFSLPGTPFIYYGDEIGMGDNIYLGDRNGVRTPMQWSADRNAGFSRANPQRLFLPVVIDPEYQPEAVNVEAQQANPNSPLWWMKRLIGLRKRHPSLGRGSLEFLYPENRKVLAYVRSDDHEHVLVVANLSRLVQYVELDLKEFRGSVPVEMFGGTELPPIGESPYFLTLGPHAFYWLVLEPQHAGAIDAGTARPVQTVEVSGTWERVFTREGRSALEAALPAYLSTARWFAGKGRRTKSVEIADLVPVRHPATAPPDGYVALIRVEYSEGEPETYILPLTARPASDRDADAPGLLLRLKTAGGEYLLFDAVWDRAFAAALLELIASRRRLGGGVGDLRGRPLSSFRRLGGAAGVSTESTVLGAEQSNTSLAYDGRFVLKLVRRPDHGENPDLEIGAFLTESAFPHVPTVAGSIEYEPDNGEPMTVGILQGFVPNEGDAWRYTLDALESYVECALARPTDERDAPLPAKALLLELADTEPPDVVRETIGTYLESARLLGRRTAELHLALSARDDDPAFAPEPITPYYQRSLYQSMRTQTSMTFRLLRAARAPIPEGVRLLESEHEILRRFRGLLDFKINAKRIRVHGDYHLGQVLFTGKDFVIIDFEGEPARPLSERRIKRAALRDVAGMLRSFHYAAYTVLLSESGIVRPEDRETVESWLHAWYVWVSASFLRSYLDTAGFAPFLPESRRELEVMLDAFVLEKAVYELAYELNNRPDWVRIPALGILQLLEAGA